MHHPYLKVLKKRKQKKRTEINSEKKKIKPLIHVLQSHMIPKKKNKKRKRREHGELAFPSFLHV